MSFVLPVLLSIGGTVEQRLLVMFALVRFPGGQVARRAGTQACPCFFVCQILSSKAGCGFTMLECRVEPLLVAEPGASRDTIMT